jgi:menaquinone-dependent protoporphyrinogen IX oxidase
MRVLVVYASADGSTGEIACRIAQGLRERGHEVSDQSAGTAHCPAQTNLTCRSPHRRTAAEVRREISGH